MKFNTIVTHPGGAHKDDFLACSVLLACCPVPIVRREPTEADLADESVCVVDVGHEHMPERYNFDHHQFPRDEQPTCSLSLVLRRLDLYGDAREFCDWLESTEWFDCRGAKDTASMLGAPVEVMNRLSSPIDMTLLRGFSQRESIEPGDLIWEIMKMIGEDLLSYLKSMRTRLDFVAEHSQVWDIHSADAPFRVLFMPRTEPLPDEPSMGLTRYIATQKVGVDIVGMIYPDRRGKGFGMARYNDDRRLDFTRIEKEEDVHFAHKRGFVAKTNATDVHRLRTLIAAAWMP